MLGVVFLYSQFFANKIKVFGKNILYPIADIDCEKIFYLQFTISFANLWEYENFEFGHAR